MRERRQTAGIRLGDISQPLGIGEATVTRFEKGTRNTEGVDQILAAYAAALKTGGEELDARDYYQCALERWREDGLEPIIEPRPKLPGAVLVAEVEDAARRQGHQQPSPAPTATRKKRKGRASMIARSAASAMSAHAAASALIASPSCKRSRAPSGSNCWGSIGTWPPVYAPLHPHQLPS